MELLAADARTFWALTGAVTVALALLSSVRVLARHQRLVVRRGGRPHRVTGPGLVAWVPGWEQGTTVSLQETTSPVLVRTRSRDRVDVLLEADVRWHVADPWRTASVTSLEREAVDVVEEAVEDVLTQDVASTGLSGVLSAGAGLAEGARSRSNATLRGTGLEVDAVQVVDVAVRLDEALLSARDGR